MWPIAWQRSMRCARRPPPPSYWGMFYYRSHHWVALTGFKVYNLQYFIFMAEDSWYDFKFETIFWEQNLCEWLDQAINRVNNAKRAAGCSAPKLRLSCCFLRSVSFNYLFRSLQVLALNAFCIFFMLKFELTKNVWVLVIRGLWFKYIVLCYRMKTFLLTCYD